MRRALLSLMGQRLVEAASRAVMTGGVGVRPQTLGMVRGRVLVLVQLLTMDAALEAALTIAQLAAPAAAARDRACCCSPCERW